MDQTNRFQEALQRAAAESSESPPDLFGPGIPPPAVSSTSPESSADGGEGPEDLQFQEGVAKFSDGLQMARKNLTALEKLARDRGIFHDRTGEIQDLTLKARESLTNLEQRMAQLDRHILNYSSNLSRQALDHRKNLVSSLRSLLLQVTKKFKAVVDKRAETLQRQEDRKSLFGGGNGGEQDSRDSVASESSSSGPQQLSVFAPQQVNYHQSRAEAAQSIQRLVVELGQMFTRVASMVQAQEEMVLRIDDDVESAMHNLSQGEAYLLKYFNRISSNRSLILKVFAILISFALAFIIFVA